MRFGASSAVCKRKILQAVCVCGFARTLHVCACLSMQRVLLGTGIVLAKEGGALGKMLPVFNIFAGGPLGTGRQWCSWIHR